MKANNKFNFLRALTFTVLVSVVFSLSAVAQTNVSSTLKHVQATEAAALVKKGDVVVLDVRTPKEFAERHIAGATNIDFNAPDFLAKAGKLDREKTYLVHCASGGRSTRCLPKLEKLGFKNIVHLDGGFNAWEKAGNLVEKK